jgi:pimeloyl-ACP methyl ester carboxylesterase
MNDINCYNSNLIEGQVRLKDGRLLGYAETGDPRGRPVFYFHGFPSSRLEIHLVEASALEADLRVIAPDRPGYGLSDFQPGRTIGNWPNDMVQLAEDLEIETFSILGLSGGGPYALACARKIPERLKAVHLVSAMGPMARPDLMTDMVPLNRWGLSLTRKAPCLGKALFYGAAFFLKHYTDKVFARLAGTLPEPDRQFLNQPAVRQVLIESFRESVRISPAGPACDVVLYSRPWDFEIQEIAMEVHLWHGEQDTIVPPAIGRYLEKSLSGCRARFFLEEGHFSLIWNQSQEILKEFSE